MNDFINDCRDRIKSYPQNDALIHSSKTFMYESTLPKYSYNFSWLGRPMIQYNIWRN